MKTLKLITLTAALLMTFSALAQNQNLVGHITDENGEPMPFVNVVLLSLPDALRECNAAFASRLDLCARNGDG